MANENQAEQPAVIPMQTSDLVGVLILGGVTGLLVWILGVILHRFVFDAYLCQGDISSQCANAKNYAVAAGSLIGAIAALAGLIRLRVYRPLLVLIASLVSTWGIVQLSWDLGWFTGVLAVVVMYAVAFGLYSWIARIRVFWMALVAIAVLVIAVRLALAS